MSPLPDALAVHLEILQNLAVKPAYHFFWQIEHDFAGATVSTPGQHAAAKQRVDIQLRYQITKCPAS
jgi:hypothetical protein